MHLLLLGYFKKVLIADPIGLSTAPIWANPESFSGPALALALIAFYIQLYADFSGYTDMARGIARLLGFRLAVNFRGPYWAATPIEFWSRWHVSLSNWVKLYVFTPLSMVVWRRVRKKRAIPPATFAILLVVMSLVGLWHEISWRFLLFGVFHGGLIGLWYVLLGGAVELSGAKRWVSWAVFQTILVVSLLIFRSNGLTEAWDIATRIGSVAEGIDVMDMVPGLILVAVLTFILQWVEYCAPKRWVARKLRLCRAFPPAFPVAVAAFFVMMFFKGMSLEGVWVAPNDPFFHAEHVQFIYANF
jgi:D-alanyl-lipoteichoic acid acyltransferase DltB (MBOAT superfamily)